MNRPKLLAREESGQGMVEYGLVVAMISILVISAFVALAPQIERIFEESAGSKPLGDAQVMTSEAVYS